MREMMHVMHMVYVQHVPYTVPRPHGYIHPKHGMVGCVRLYGSYVHYQDVHVPGVHA